MKFQRTDLTDMETAGYELGEQSKIRGWILFRFAAPQAFYPLAGRMIPWFAAVAANVK